VGDLWKWWQAKSWPHINIPASHSVMFEDMEGLLIITCTASESAEFSAVFEQLNSSQSLNLIFVFHKSTPKKKNCDLQTKKVIIIIITIIINSDAQLSYWLFFTYISVSHPSQSQSTLQSLIYTSSSPSTMPSCQWLADGCHTPIDIFSHRGQSKCSCAWTESLYFCDGKITGHIASRN
jgi:hypothetical protein